MRVFCRLLQFVLSQGYKEALKFLPWVRLSPPLLRWGCLEYYGSGAKHTGYTHPKGWYKDIY